MQGGTPVLDPRRGKTYFAKEFPSRSNLVKLQYGVWDCAEHCEPHAHKREARWQRETNGNFQKGLDCKKVSPQQKRFFRKSSWKVRGQTFSA